MPNSKPTEPQKRLKAYRAKRDFARTPEPEDGRVLEPASRFVVQKHNARRIHFDLRLEFDGVLLSWAVPQGPSLIPAEKRLAVRTEDHPLKHLEFEGKIPKGEYGGGTTIVWDRGQWKALHDPGKSLTKGHLEFELHGERLKGRWHLVRMKPRPRETKEQWLLIKAEDEYARAPSDRDVVKEAITSVVSGRTNEDLDRDIAVRADHEERGRVSTSRKVKLPDPGAIAGARRGLLRVFVEPCLASPAKEQPKGPKWLHEVKFDGYRIQARVDGREIRLLTRKGLDWTARFPPIADAVRQLALGSALMDGEIIVEDATGLSNFNELVSDLSSGRKDRFRYCVFDLLYLNGVDLQRASLLDRKELLSTIFVTSIEDKRLALSEHFTIDGDRFFSHVSRLGFEGMISKRVDSTYRSGRTADWLKSKCVLIEEFVIVGYVPSTTASRTIGSLVLGFHQDGALVHAGRVGSGFSQGAAAQLFAKLDPDRTGRPQFRRKLADGADSGVRWVAPRFVAQVEYRGWSIEGLLRQASFRGLREDIDAREVAREHRAFLTRASGPQAPAFTHPDRMLWPAEGVTKQGPGDYYAAIADKIMPHLTGRALSLVRCPSGVAAKCYFAKHGWAGLGDAVRRVDAPGDEPLLSIDVLAGLLALVQGNVLEIHPWGSRISDLERPDRFIFDLDPDEEVSWPAVVDAAKEVRERLNTDLKLESFVKTTGGKGLHVVVPLVPSVDWEEAKSICKGVADAMSADSPARYVSNMAKRARKGKIFIDDRGPIQSGRRAGIPAEGG